MSLGKRKRLSSDDTSSLASCKSSGLFSLTNSVAYGAHEDFDESDLDYDTVSQMESEKPMNVRVTLVLYLSNYYE